MNWRQAPVKILSLAIVGFMIPLGMLLPVDYALYEFGSKLDLEIVLSRYLPPSVGCSLLFTASAMASSLPNSRITFVQALFLLGATFIVSVICFTPIQHYTSDEPPDGFWACLPSIAVLGISLL